MALRKTKTATKKNVNVKKKGVSIPSDDDDDDCVELSSFFVLKNKCDMRRYDNSEECFILDFDPYEVEDKEAKKIDEDITLVSEKGQVACRDYPHSRNLCLKFPFDKTPHQSYCKLCYCYVCDEAAPCDYWKGFLYSHCNVSDKDPVWQRMRDLAKEAAE